MGWKYIVLEKTTPLGVRVEFPVIFPDKMVHAEVAEVIRLVEPLNEEATVVSAGSIEGLSVHYTGGRSSTLGIGSRGDEDKKLITLFPYLHGIKTDG